MSESVSQSVSQSVSESVSESVSQSVSEFVLVRECVKLEIGYSNVHYRNNLSIGRLDFGYSNVQSTY